MSNPPNHQAVIHTIHEVCRAFDMRDWTALRGEGHPELHGAHRRGLQ